MLSNSARRLTLVSKSPFAAARHMVAIQPGRISKNKSTCKSKKIMGKTGWHRGKLEGKNNNFDLWLPRSKIQKKKGKIRNSPRVVVEKATIQKKEISTCDFRMSKKRGKKEKLIKYSQGQRKKGC